MMVLNEQQIDKAKVCNLFYSRYLTETTPPFVKKLIPDSSDFALAIAKWQENHSLLVDGILGPKSLAALQGEQWRSPVGRNYIIVAGEEVPTTFPVVNWMQRGGLSFDHVKKIVPGWNGFLPRDDPRREGIDKFVLHW
jgi:hypothetical protein